MFEQTTWTELVWIKSERLWRSGESDCETKNDFNSTVSMTSKQLKAADAGGLCQHLLVHVERKLLTPELCNCELLLEAHQSPSRVDTDHS